MARCGCANGACSCKVTGDGLRVTGFGTEASPFVVSTGLTEIEAPLTGNTVVVTDTTRTLLLQPAGTLAALTLQLPLVPLALDHEIVVITTQIITALTVTGSGAQTVAGQPTTLAANGFFRTKLIGTVWRRD